MSNLQQKAKEIFLESLEHTNHETLKAYVDQACGDHAELRQQVEHLISSHQNAGRFLGGVDCEAETFDVSISREKAGSQIGPYKLLEQIGEGGMGVVYMAEQKEPVRRRVALKIIKPGMDTRQVIARFEAERQALAMMDHPNIAKVLDAGATESGRPYFVMELVNGLPVTMYCDEQHLTPKERLELFVPICHAVQHAHQKGIIHRDLKPSNILVALYDGQAVPKIIDFGVAKATSQTLTEKTMFTQLGQVVGTLEYMSPEQAQRNQLDIDTRSDIYSLGVVLYELLTGETPFDRERLRSAAFDEMLRIIREEEPSKPSAKVSSSQSLPSIAANRRIEPAKLGSLIRGELDWIIMKAMDKDRGRRYETTSKLAEDIQHYLDDKPVEACPPSAAYRFRKFARRNKAIIGTLAIVSSCLMLGLIGTTWQAFRASRAEQIAESNYDRAIKSEREAKARADRLQGAMVVIGEQIAGKILNLALTGEKQAALIALSNAKTSDFELKKSLLDSIEAMIFLYSDDPGKAEAILKRVREEEPGSFAGCSASYITLNHQGHYGEKANALRPILNWEPQTNVEKLFFCQVWCKTKPAKVIDILDDVLAEEPLWGAAYQLRGRARMELAMDYYQSDTANQMFESGISDLRRADELSASEFTRAGYLISLVQACEYAEYRSRKDQLEYWQREAYRVYDALGDSNGCQGDAFVARTSFLAFLQDRETLGKQWEKMTAERADDWVGGASLFGKGDMQALDKLISAGSFENTAWPKVMKAYYLADTLSDGERFKRVSGILEDTFADREFATDDEQLATDVYLLLGKPKLAKDVAARTLEKPSLAEGGFWRNEGLRYLLEQTEDAENELMRAAGPFGDRRVLAHYLIAMVALSKGARDKAITQFEMTVSLGRMDWWPSVWAHAFKSRLQNPAAYPNWPAWIDVQVQDTSVP